MELGVNGLRPPAVAGLFYPAEAHVLRRDIAQLLARAGAAAGARPRALIVPHAGYIYSGIVAAEAYARLAPWRETITRVVLFGPAHRVAIDGAALSGARAFATPLGEVPLDHAAAAMLRALAGVSVSDRAHAPEHSLEVQLPFLQTQLERFSLLPVLVAERDPKRVSTWMAPWWDDDDTLIVVSTDLSHYHDYAGARAIDSRTDGAIMAFDDTRIGPEQACGCHPLNGLLHLARARDATIERLMLCNSGDTAGPRDAVVGYAAYTIA